jgi:hypothetical protein
VNGPLHENRFYTKRLASIEERFRS